MGKQNKICPEMICTGHDVFCKRFQNVLGDVMGYNGDKCWACMHNDLNREQDICEYWQRILTTLKANDNGTYIMEQRIEGVSNVIKSIQRNIDCLQKRMNNLEQSTGCR